MNVSIISLRYAYNAIKVVQRRSLIWGLKFIFIIDTAIHSCSMIFYDGKLFIDDIDDASWYCWSITVIVSNQVIRLVRAGISSCLVHSTMRWELPSPDAMRQCDPSCKRQMNFNYTAVQLKARIQIQIYIKYTNHINVIQCRRWQMHAVVRLGQKDDLLEQHMLSGWSVLRQPNHGIYWNILQLPGPISASINCEPRINNPPGF